MEKKTIFYITLLTVALVSASYFGIEDRASEF